MSNKNETTNPFLLRATPGDEILNFAGFNFIGRITADDLTVAVNNTVQDFNIALWPIEGILHKTLIRLVTPFENTADAAYNTTTVVIKDDDGTPNTVISSKELNKNGAYIGKDSSSSPAVFSNTAYGPYIGAVHLIAEFGSQSGKKLSDINKGELHIFAQLLYPKALSKRLPLAVISTK